ncbi:MAG: type II toxin-antitoxin system VapC family toxin [Opitutaceae bacterium]|nr:type II toxin-antitoxin system VapC family toxin [Opitutaceae bacterium]
MTAYADTSFLFALYLREANTPLVRKYLGEHRRALVFTSLQRYELRNAIRLAVFRRYTDDATAITALARVELDCMSGNLDDTPLIWPDVLEAADALGEKQTRSLGVRALDLLHVGAASVLGAKIFLTFDVRQHALAKAAGLNVGP